MNLLSKEAMFKNVLRLAQNLLLLIWVAACSGRGSDPLPHQLPQIQIGSDCTCPGGHLAVRMADAAHNAQCACFLQQQPLTEGLGVFALLNERAQPFWRFELSETIDSVVLFLPAQGLLLATRPEGACGESLSAYALHDGQRRASLTAEGQCLSDLLSSVDGQQLFVMNKTADSAHVLASAYSLKPGLLEPSGAQIDLGTGIPRSRSAVAIDTERILQPMLQIGDGASSGSQQHFVVVDFAQQQAQSLFQLEATEWMKAMHVSHNVAVIEISNSEASDAAHSLAAYDLQTGQVLGTRSGQLLSRQGEVIIFQQTQGRVRAWAPWDDSAGTESESYGERDGYGDSAFTAQLGKKAVALTGMGPQALQTRVFQLESAEETLRFDGAYLLQAGEELRSKLLFVHNQGIGIIQHLYICEPGSCGAGPIVVSQPNHRDKVFYAAAIHNSRTIFLGRKDPADSAYPYTLFALNPQNMDVQKLGDFTAQAVRTPLFAPAGPAWRW